MKTMILLAAVTMMASLSAQARPGDAGESYICVQKTYQEIEKNGYFHYVMPNVPYKVGTQVQITDYAANYAKINAVVTSSDSQGIVLESPADKFRLVMYPQRATRPGAGFGGSGMESQITHKNQKDYKIDCNLSGGAQLE
jgi:hypothetical protein